MGLKGLAQTYSRTAWLGSSMEVTDVQKVFTKMNGFDWLKIIIWRV